MKVVKIVYICVITLILTGCQFGKDDKLEAPKPNPTPGTANPDALDRYSILAFGKDKSGYGVVVEKLTMTSAPILSMKTGQVAIKGDFLAVTAGHIIDNIGGVGTGPHRVNIWDKPAPGIMDMAEVIPIFRSGGSDVGVLVVINTPPGWNHAVQVRGDDPGGSHAAVTIRGSVPFPHGGYDRAKDGKGNFIDRMFGPRPEPGDSGAPLFFDGSVAGVIVSRFSRAPHVGYITAPEIRTALLQVM